MKACKLCHLGAVAAVWLATLIVAVQSAEGVTWSGNLLTNPGAEAGDLTGWTTAESFVIASQSQAESTGTVTPHTDDWFFNMAGAQASPATTGLLYQNVDVTSYAASIDAGLVLGRGATWLQTENAASLSGFDSAQLTIRFRDTGGNPLDTLTTGLVTSPNLTWVQEELEGPVPVGTRSIEVELLGYREETTWVNAFFDDVSLQVGVIPEPLTMLGMVLGLGSVGAYIRKRRLA